MTVIRCVAFSLICVVSAKGNGNAVWQIEAQHGGQPAVAVFVTLFSVDELALHYI